MSNPGLTSFMPFLLKALNDMTKMHLSNAMGGPQLSNNPGDRFTGRTHTFRRNLRVVQKAQRRRAFYRSLKSKNK